MIQHLEALKYLIFHPYVIAFISLFIGCYLIRDIMRVVLDIFDGTRRADKHLDRQEEDYE